MFVVVGNNIKGVVETLSSSLFLDPWLVVLIIDNVVVGFLVGAVLSRYDWSILRDGVLRNADNSENLEWESTVTSFGN